MCWWWKSFVSNKLTIKYQNYSIQNRFCKLLSALYNRHLWLQTLKNVYRVSGSPKHQHINPNFSHTVFPVRLCPAWSPHRLGALWELGPIITPSTTPATDQLQECAWSTTTLFRYRSTRKKWEPVWTSASNQDTFVFCHDWKGSTGHWEIALSEDLRFRAHIHMRIYPCTPTVFSPTPLLPLLTSIPLWEKNMLFGL